MKIRTYTRGQVIFREGDAGDCMFDIQEGKVGIFSDYQGPQEKQIAVLFTDQIFGEMGLLDGAPRSATAVALETAVVDVVSEDEFYEYFEKKPVSPISFGYSSESTTSGLSPKWGPKLHLGSHFSACSPSPGRHFYYTPFHAANNLKKRESPSGPSRCSAVCLLPVTKTACCCET